LAGLFFVYDYGMLFSLLGKVWKKMPRGMRIFAARSIQVNFTASAGGIITNEQGRVLLLNHFLRPDSGWGIPGGFLNAGEQPEEAFRREVCEETGINVEDVSFLRVRTTGRHMEFIYSARAVGNAEVMSSEISELAWFDIDKLPEEISGDQLDLIRKAVNKSGERT